MLFEKLRKINEENYLNKLCQLHFFKDINKKRYLKNGQY